MRKVVLEFNPDTVLLKNTSPSYVYIARFRSRSCYKLHENCDGKWSFVSLRDSTYHANGFHSSMRAAISAAIHEGADVFEIKNLKDFIEYLRAHE